jgi:tryptophanyl-tRNA synthetase
MWEYFREFREKRAYYHAHQDEVRDILNQGAIKAKMVAQPLIQKIREVTGIKY